MAIKNTTTVTSVLTALSAGGVETSLALPPIGSTIEGTGFRYFVIDPTGTGNISIAPLAGTVTGATLYDSAKQGTGDSILSATMVLAPRPGTTGPSRFRAFLLGSADFRLIAKMAGLKPASATMQSTHSTGETDVIAGEGEDLLTLDPDFGLTGDEAKSRIYLLLTLGTEAD